MPERKPIFYDQEKLRWRRTRMALEIAGGLFTLVLIVFLLNIVRRPELPALLSPTTGAGLRAIRIRRQRTRTPRPNRNIRKLNDARRCSSIRSDNDIVVGH